MAYNLEQWIWIHPWKRLKVEDERSRFATYTIKRRRLLLPKSRILLLPNQK